MTDVRVVTEPLGGSPLSRLLQRGDAPRGWLPARPASVDEWRARADARRHERDWRSHWDALLPALAPNGQAAARLARVQDGGGIVVTTGQQPGLFGGPVYTWSKAVSALAMADALQDATGIPTAPVFWAATDDADFAEAATTSVARSGGLDVLRATLAPPAGTPMSLAPLGDLGDALMRLREASGSAADPRAIEAATLAYGNAERTHGDAFVALLRTMLEPLGIPVLDASHAAVTMASEPTVRAALVRADEIERALSARAREIRSLGHEPQVDDVAGLALAFVRERDVKRRLTVAEAARAGGHLTPNVLLRPVVEHSILPTVAYMAGPGELAYFAQVSAVADALGVASPLAVPRWSCTLIEPHVQRLLDRFGVEVADLDRPDALEGRVARAAMSDDSARALQHLRDEIARLTQSLAAETDPLGLGPAVKGAAQSLAHRVARLERRLVAGIKRRESGQMRDVATLRAALRPRGGRQERTLNLIPTLSRNGSELLLEMARASGAHASSLVAPGRPSATAGVTA